MVTGGALSDGQRGNVCAVRGRAPVFRPIPPYPKIIPARAICLPPCSPAGCCVGFSEAAAIRLAARFVALAAEQTLHAGADPRFGVRFEPLLGTLSHWAETPGTALYGRCFSAVKTPDRRSAISPMKPLNIVLVEPQIPQNIGNISGTWQRATGARLHLVGPMGFTVDDKKLKRAGLDYWHLLDITYYEGLTDFFARNEGPFYYFTTKAPQRYTDVAYPDGAYLVFGREDAGLPEALLVENQEACVRLPMIPDARSLNLSNTVAVGVYEALRQRVLQGLLDTGRLRGYEWK